MHHRPLRAAGLLLLFMATPAAWTASKTEINAQVQAALTEFYDTISGGRTLTDRAAGILVFPQVLKAGIGFGGEYGEGALLVNGATRAYYNIASASIGFQLGAQVKREIIMFLTEEALVKFENSDGWEAGVDGSVALVTVGAGGEVDTNSLRSPVIGFVFSNKGLMYNLTFEGSKISRIKD